MTGGRVEQNGSCEIAIALEASSSFSVGGTTNVTANITGGTVVGGININGGTMAMWSSKPSLTIGSNSDELSTTNPLILSGENNTAVTGSNANFYFYNGKIGGQTEPYSLATTGTRTGDVLANGEENIEGVSYKTAYYMGRTEGWSDKVTPIADGEGGVIPLPDGFSYVGGTKSEGIVISDNSADAGKGTSWEVAKNLKGNQFVWVPVENDSEFKTYKHYKNGISQSITSYKDVATGTLGTEQDEYDAMEASVLLYNGFYVGRYEAGVEEERTSGINDEVAIKQGKDVYNYIEWSNSNDPKNHTGGAVELSKNFDNKYPLAKNKKIILYAPTFRDNEEDNNVFNYLDLEKFNNALSEEYVLALRLHPKINQFFKGDIDTKADFIDVSDYKNEQELMLISDLLITDYSSIMIEFALLNKPIIFFTYDYDRYLTKDRGFYYDFESNVPGDIVKTDDELIKLIKEGSYNTEKHNSFLKMQFDYLDGNSSKRIIDFILEE